MYSSFHSTSQSVAQSIRSDIFSLLGNSGKTIFSPAAREFSFSFRFLFSQSLHKAVDMIEQIAYRKPLTYIAISLATLMISPSETSFAAEPITVGMERTFIITAYYSPMVWQQSYYRGSYEADIRLNGRGTHGASGTPVFTGMLAAPKTYAFGTQIFFDGLGLGTVQDRGGAIVDAYVRGQPHDRLDIWMWHGDAALRRTIAWGRRTVKGLIMSGSTATPINFMGIDNGSINLNQYPPVWSLSIGGMSAEVISAFADLGYNFTGTDTKSMIIEFQIDNNIIPSRDDEAAGIYGPKTRSTLASLHAAYTARRQKELDLIDIAKKALLKDHENYNSEYSDAQSRVISFGQPRLKQSGDNIARLQEFLIAGRYYTSSVDSQMSPRTLIALRKYQRSKDIRPTGSLDESTRSAMIDDIVSL